jgi:hypothetical protein
VPIFGPICRKITNFTPDLGISAMRFGLCANFEKHFKGPSTKATLIGSDCSDYFLYCPISRVTGNGVYQASGFYWSKCRVCGSSGALISDGKLILQLSILLGVRAIRRPSSSHRPLANLLPLWKEYIWQRVEPKSWTPDLHQ